MTRGELDVLAHELRSPVAALAAIAETASSAGVSADDLRRLVALALGAGRGIESLLADHGDPRLERRVVRIGQIARDVVDSAALTGALVSLEAADDPDVDADPSRLRRAVANLVENAVGHSPHGATVRVIVRRVGDEALVEVADDGEGIALEDQQRIFEPGVRLTDGRPGSGLGLALVREVADVHGGTVRVRSAPGEGAVFTLALPLASARA